MLEIFALIVLVVLIATAITLLVIIGNLPGKMARAAGHPQAEAINLLAWVGLLTLGVGWVIALVWVKVKPVNAAPAVTDKLQDLENRLGQLEANQS